jgi:hypothetical protein
MKISSPFSLFACLLLGHFVAAVPALARQDVVPGSRYTSARGAALGDAYLPLGEDGGAGLFYNPSVIGKVKKFEATPMDFSMYANSGFTDTFDATSFYKVTSLSEYKEKLAESQSFSGAGVSLLPSFATRGFAMGILLSSQVGARHDNQTDTIRYKSTYQFIPAIGTGVSLAHGIIRLGYSLQWVNKAEGDITVPAAQATGYDQNLPQGSGFSHTLAAALTFPTTYLPSFNLVARNVGNTSYGGGSLVPFAQNSPGGPPVETMSFDASFSIAPRLGSGVYVNLVVEDRDVLNTSKVILLQRMALGAELVFRDAFFVRAGLGSGYPCAGIGMKQKDSEFSITWYSEEIGTTERQKDARFMFQYKISAF